MSKIPDIDYKDCPANKALEKAVATSIKLGGDMAILLHANHEAIKNNMLDANGNPTRPTAVTVSAIRSSKKEDNRYALPEVNKQAGPSSKSDGFDTTAHLQWLSSEIKKGDYKNAERAIDAILKFTTEAIKKSPNLKENQIDLLLQELTKKIDKFKADLDRKCSTGGRFTDLGLDNYILDTEGKAISLIGFGEDLTHALYVAYFQDVGTQFIKVPNFMNDVFHQGLKAKEIKEILRNPAQAIEMVVEGMRNKFIEVNLDGTRLYIAGGHQPVIASSRGYSDVAAAIAALAMLLNGHQNVILDVHKNFPILSADPRSKISIDKLKVIPGIKYPAAAELFGHIMGANAGAIHPNAIKHLVQTQVHKEIKTVVRHPHIPENGATLISDEIVDNNPRMNVIAAKKLKSSLNISGNAMIDNPGVLAFIADFFEEYSVSNNIDSAGSLLLGFNDEIPPNVLEKFKKKLVKKFGECFITDNLKNLAVVYCVGNNPNLPDQTTVGIATLEAAGIKVYGQNSKAINPKDENGPGVCTFVVHQDDVANATAALHQNMIEAPKRVVLVPA